MTTELLYKHVVVLPKDFDWEKLHKALDEFQSHRSGFFWDDVDTSFAPERRYRIFFRHKQDAVLFSLKWV